MAQIKKPEVAVPEEAVGRGPILLGELRSEHHIFDGVLAQFDNIEPSSRKARLYLFPTAEQARKLDAERSPFSFEGSFTARDGVVEYRSASDIWLKSITQMPRKEALYWAHTSGQIGALKIREVYDDGPLREGKTGLPFAWFVADRCFLLQVIANPERENEEDAKKYGFSHPKIHLRLTDGAIAEVHRYLRSHRPGVMRDTKKMGYSIHVRDYKNATQAKADADALLLLASFASRERAVSTHWGEDTVKEESVKYWRFNWEKFPKRDDHEEPLLPRGREHCQDFIQKAFDTYSKLQYKTALDSAIYALLSRNLTQETEFARLFFGIQGALTFALQEPKPVKNHLPKVYELLQRFSSKYTFPFSDLWPLCDPCTGVSLSNIRNSIVHGEGFSEKDSTALSFAAENLRWHLERIVLVALGWDVEKSAVSPDFLKRYYAYQWQNEQKNFKI